MSITKVNHKRAVLRLRPGQFVVTPAIERVVIRALRYLRSGFPIHLRGPAGTGKTTLGMHLANCLDRPVMLLFGDDQFKSSDLIGSESGYTHKKLLDNYIHSVVKVEDEFKQNWVDSRLTLACREGFTLVYDEFNRSRPEVNNVLLSALEEKILSLPPSSNQPEYLSVNPQFRVIFTSNPEEYCGVHSTQDALMDRLVTINMPEPDEITQTEILIQKTNIGRESANLIVRLVKSFRLATGAEKTSGLRSCLMIAKICADHDIPASTEDLDFREIAMDILFNRAQLSISESTDIFMGLLEQFSAEEIKVLNDTHLPTDELLINNSQFITQELVTQPNTELANDIPQELRKTEQN
ncbi:MAG: gas vesicle protein GvpN [Dolichospermum sp.]|jgi:gas vesicle protein GvpN|nr:gas vesicle protein GvpN [Dolichospermum circinale Clear-D4]MCE2721382.1 gas vesicle protein GvpN [Anabaena sp. 49628_E55]